MPFTHALLNLFYLAVFPGLVFTATLGLMTTWVDRKVSARLQYRVGPPWFQPFADIAKLLGKTTFVPRGAKGLGFLLAPFAGLAGVTLASTVLWVANMKAGSTFVGDLIVVIYLLMLPSLAIVVGGSSSRNPLGAVGVAREVKLLLAYELPVLIALMTPVVKTGGITSLGGLVEYQQANGWLVAGPSGVLALIAAVLAFQAKLSLAPFDIAEAETELIAGPFIEYSGAPLALFKLTRAMMLAVAPVLLITLFGGGAWSPWAILEYAAVLVAFVLIKNTNPRVRVDQALRFFWLPVLALAVVGIVLAAVGY